MKLAIMQPYFFPYIGYFQLINAVDTFVIYDDVNYIKQGWINRNRILFNGKPFYFTINLKRASSFKKINDIEIDIDSPKMLKTIYQAYNKASYFYQIYPLIERVLISEEFNLAKYVSSSIVEIAKYLGIETEIYTSSEKRIGLELKGKERVIAISKYLNAMHYYNAIGGKDIYSKDEFIKSGIKLNFIKTKEIIYKQFDDNFVPFLSIIDVMMFNSKNEICKMLEMYELV